MPNRYATITGTNRISDEWNYINEGFDGVQADVDDLREDVSDVDAAAQAAQAAADAAQTSANQAQTAADTAQDDADAAQAAIAGLDERIDNIVAQSGDDITEIVDARQPATGTAYATLKNRLDASDNRISVSASPPSTPLANSIWYEDLGESPDLGGGGLIIANAALDGSQDIWFAVET
jgi:small-conductance mechanosensitive channel